MSLNLSVEIDGAKYLAALRKMRRKTKQTIDGIVSDSSNLDKALMRTAKNLEQGNLLRGLDAKSSDIYGKMSQGAQKLAKDIQDVAVALAQLQKMQRSLTSDFDQGLISQDAYTTAMARLCVLEDELTTQIQDNEAALRKRQITSKQEEGSIEALQTKISLLTTDYMRLSEAQRNGPQGETLLKNLSEAQVKMQTATAAMNGYARNAGTGFNTLNFQVQQLARELPSLAVGPHMFFLAISNNLPMLADELARARREYDALTATGKTATPVWKQVVSSILSWQTAMVGSITLLTLYGDKIVKWVADIFKGQKAAIDMAEALRDMNEAMDFSGVGKQITDFRSLQQVWNSLGDDVNAQKQFLIDYNGELEKLDVSVNDIVDAEILFVRNSDSYIQSLVLRAQAAAGLKLASEQYAEAIKNDVENGEKLAKLQERLNFLRKQDVNYTETFATGVATAPTAEHSRDALIKGVETAIANLKKQSDNAIARGNAYVAAAQSLTATDKETRRDLSLDASLENLRSQEASLRQHIENLEAQITQAHSTVIRKALETELSNYKNDLAKTTADIERLTDKSAHQSYGAAYESAKKEWASAKRELDKINKDRGSYTIEQYKEAEEAEKKARESYERLGGDTGQERPRRHKDDKALSDKHKQELIRQAIDLEFQVRQATINAKEQGTEKILEQNKLDYDKQKEQIRRQQDDLLAVYQEQERKLWEAANPDWEKLGLTFTPEAKLPQNIIDQFNKLNEANNQDLERKNKAATDRAVEQWNIYLSKYGDYQQKRLAITELYNKKIAEAATDGEKKSLERELEEALSELDTEANKAVSALNKLFDDMHDKTSREMRAIADNAEEALRFVTNGVWDEEKGISFGITKETFETLGRSPEKLEAARKGIDDIRLAADKADGPISKIRAGFQALFNTKPGTKAFDDALDRIKDGLTELQAKLDATGELFANMGDAFGATALTSVSEAINTATGMISGAMKGAEAGSLFGPVGMGVGAVLGGVTSLVSSLNAMHDRRYERTIQRLQSEIDELTRSYEKLDRVRDKSYSTKTASVIAEQNKALREQQKLIYQQIQAERGKKKTDQNRIKEWQNELEDIDQQILDNFESIREAINGITFDSFRNDFLDALTDMSVSAEDFSAEFKNKLQRSFYDSLLTNKYDEQIRALYNRWAELGEKGLTGASMEDLQRQEQELIDRILADREKYSKLFGWSSDEGDVNSMRGDISKSITELTASKLEGLMRGGYDVLKDNGNTLKINCELLTAIKDMQMRGWGEINDIWRSVFTITANTTRIADNTEILSELARYLQNIERNTTTKYYGK
ncbi:MAG: hypothetical protein DBY00_04375 [Flavobacteriales bacterium]|nr:MAG: hypothetical protein DBY00_04375 [Flavobacteriales bacterium]